MKDQKEFLIMGYSFGSLIAIELARLLEAKNFSGRLILIDGAPDQMIFLSKKFFYNTSEQKLQNNILLYLARLQFDFNNEMVSKLLKTRYDFLLKKVKFIFNYAYICS